MPIYEYECTDCGGEFEHLHASGGKGAPPCPDCGGTSAKRLFSSFSVNNSPSFGGGTTCCGSSDPSEAGCAGPGSCCSGK